MAEVDEAYALDSLVTFGEVPHVDLRIPVPASEIFTLDDAGQYLAVSPVVCGCPRPPRWRRRVKSGLLCPGCKRRVP